MQLQRIIQTLGLLLFGLITLAACGNKDTSIAGLLPLASDRPTFVYFYTEN